MVFVIFVPRTVNTANINENTAMIKIRMVGVKISVTVNGKNKKSFCFFFCFAVSIVVFCFVSGLRLKLENFSCPKIKQKSLHNCE